MAAYELTPYTRTELYGLVKGYEHHVEDRFILNTLKRFFSVAFSLPTASLRGVTNENKIKNFIQILKETAAGEDHFEALERDYRMSKNFFEARLGKKTIGGFKESIKIFEESATEKILPKLKKHDEYFLKYFKRGLDYLNCRDYREPLENMVGVPYFKLELSKIPETYGEPAERTKRSYFYDIKPTIDFEISTFEKFRDKLDHKKIDAMAWIEAIFLENKIIFLEMQTNKIKCERKQIGASVVMSDVNKHRRALEQAVSSLEEIAAQDPTSPGVVTVFHGSFSRDFRATEPADEIERAREEFNKAMLKGFMRNDPFLRRRINLINRLLAGEVIPQEDLVFLSDTLEDALWISAWVYKYPIIQGINFAIPYAILVGILQTEHGPAETYCIFRKKSKKLPEMAKYSEVCTLYGGKETFLNLPKLKWLGLGPHVVSKGKPDETVDVKVYFWPAKK